MSLESTAMADIIFLLLIFFLLSSSFILQVGTKVNLPKEARPDQIEDKGSIVITLEENGAIHVGKTRVTMAELEAELAQRLEEDRDRAVIIRGDEKIGLGVAINVMDVAKRLGAGKLAIATQPRGS